MKTTIYFVRHGNVENPKDIWYGRMPGYGLSKLGENQLEQTATFLKEKKINYIYSSPQLRAKESAIIIQKKLRLKKIYLSRDIAEIKSSLQGQTFAYLESILFDVFASPHNPTIIGESIDDVSTRMQKFISSMIKKHPGKNIIAVSHGDPIMLVKTAFEGLSLMNASIRPGGDKYMQQGEVYQLVCEGNNQTSLKSIFKPTL